MQNVDRLPSMEKGDLAVQHHRMGANDAELSENPEAVITSRSSSHTRPWQLTLCSPQILLAIE